MAEAPPLPYGNEMFEVCLPLPPKVNSVGTWENLTSPSVILAYSLPLLELQVLLIFVVTHLVYAILKPLGITMFASQMFAGMIMGPAVLGQIEGFRNIFIQNELVLEALDTAAGLGFAIFLFLMGVKMDASHRMASRRAQDHKLRAGTTGLSAAAVSDLSKLVLYEFFSLARCWLCHRRWLWSGQELPSFLVLFLVVRPWMFWVIRTTPEGKPIEEVYIMIIVMLALASGMFSNWLEHSPLPGAFLVGVAVPDGLPLGSTIVEKIPLRDSMALALIMSTKGIVELSYLSSFKDSKCVDTFHSSKCNYNPNPGEVSLRPCFKKIRMLSAKKHNALSELRVVACVHRPEHILALVDMFDITCLTKESPNVV
ncbi:cation/H(+) antiporter 8-like [Hibiscus syriacus]|uniref:cation/H(+) antiporter 8-like n=1 Tax=Hibiscus syriacus TaxID=106335 RepID=UPI0019231474|nr:cation/H(+) antiporter 8-like [Hibiscus syriacus]